MNKLDIILYSTHLLEKDLEPLAFLISFSDKKTFTSSQLVPFFFNKVMDN
jgi:hypothetical protein